MCAPRSFSAITSPSSASLAQSGVVSTGMLSVAAPSVVIGRFSNSARPFVRGIGSTVADPNNEPSVAIYLDGVYPPAAFANFFDFNNVERIEVLKGPQGTLFGRNATGGVIQVVTRDPGDTPEFEASAGYANYDKYSVSAYAAAPISDKVGVSIAAMYSDQAEGYGRNLVTGKDVRLGDELGVRAGVRAHRRPDDQARGRLLGARRHRRGIPDASRHPQRPRAGMAGRI